MDFLEFIAKFGSFLSALVALSIALWGRKWMSMLYRPKIALEAGDCLPLTQEFFSHGSRWLILRLRLCNEGNEVAEGVEVHVVDVQKFEECDNLKPDDRFLPCKLVWTHGSAPERKDRITRGNIYPKTSAMIDLGNIRTWGAEGESLLSLVSEISTANSIWEYREGRYRIKLLVSCTKGPLWKGSVDVSFDRWTRKQFPKHLDPVIDFNSRVVCCHPELGLDHCDCG
jgi:hypothetical protein